MAGKAIRALKRAQAGRTFVRIHRSIEKGDSVDGYVLGVGRKWLLVAELDELDLVGVSAIRTRDVRRVRRRKVQATARHVLELRGQWPPTAPQTIDLDRSRSVLSALVSEHALVSVFIERRAADCCWVGVPTSFRSKGFQLRGLNPDLSWGTKPTRWRWKHVTRLDVDNRYLRALTAGAEGIALVLASRDPDLVAGAAAGTAPSL
jgi:hypothetical protein